MERYKKESLPKCPFCDHPRKGNLVCEKCGADLVWMIPWSEGGAALPALPAPPRDQKEFAPAAAT